MITLQEICKTFRVVRRNAGFTEAVKSLFHKEYTEIHALKNVSFKIADGEMVGYIGPNGAGKSSTIKIMSGILTPDSGTCDINGFTPWKSRREYVGSIGVVFGQRSQLWWDVPVIDSFELIRDIYKVSDVVYKRNFDELVTSLELGEIVRTPARQLSLGQRMRCEIAASLLHDPKILFLDEPTIGLDAVSKIAVRKFIRQINQTHKTTVILTTHDMQDIEALTERILLIGRGQILLDGSLSDLKKKNSAFKKIAVEYTSGSIVLSDGISMKADTEGHADLLVDTEIISVSAAIAKLAQSAEITDLSVSVEGSTSEELVVALYKEFQI